MSYGLQLLDDNGTTVVVGPGIRAGAVVGYASNVYLTTATNDSYPNFVDIVMDMDGISFSTVAILLISGGFSGTGFTNSSFSFLTDRIRMTLPSNFTSYYGDVMVVRF